MPSGIRLVCLAILCALLAIGAASGQTAAPTFPVAATPEVDPQILAQRAAETRFLKTLLGAEAPKTRARACFTRVYDAPHLKAHPYQHVVEIRVSAHYDPVERMRKEVDAPRSKWGYAIRSRLRDGKIKTFLDDGSCSFWPRLTDSGDVAGYVIRCNAACDSGDDFNLTLDGKSAKLANKDELVHPEYTEPGAPDKLAAKADDGVFRLYRAKDSLCDFDRP